VIKNDIEKGLKDRKDRLAEIINLKKFAKSEKDEGYLDIRKRNGRVQYYIRYLDENNKIKAKYTNDIKIAEKLAQHAYDKKVLRAAEMELKAIRRFELDIPEYAAEEIYGCMHSEKQKLIIPVEEPLENFITAWKAADYQKKAFRDGDPVFITIRGERMRSKSEIMIADMLHNHNIPYKYECPLNLIGFGNVYPDFTLINTETRRELYWEHFGRMDDPDYAAKTAKKIVSYEQNGIYIGENLIVTFETLKTPLDQLTIAKKIERHLR